MSEMKFSARQNIISCAAALAGIALVTAFYKFEIANVNATTVALSLLLVVLVLSSARGLAPGVVASVAGMLCLNYFFLPPMGTLTIEDPQNWVALVAFLITAVIASQLSATARARAQDAERRREELLKLYRLSQAIILSPDPDTAVSALAREVVSEFDADHCAIFGRQQDGGWRRLGVATKHLEYQAFAPSTAQLEECFRGGEIMIGTASSGGRTEGGTPKTLACAPLTVGVRPTGVLTLLGNEPGLERSTVEAIAGLVSLALERARFLQEVSRTEALRQSDELKSALLAAVSHDLRTPLTSIRAAIDSLLQEGVNWNQEALHEFHLIISEEVARLTRLVQNLLEMARIEAGELPITKQWAAVSEIITNVIERCRDVTRDHRVIVDATDSLPLVSVDSLLVVQALSHLIENAAAYSPAGSDVTIGVRVCDGKLVVSVEDCGMGIAREEIPRIFDKFYRTATAKRHRIGGTGMGLSIARGIIEAHGGKLRVESEPGRGSVFTFEIPVEVRASEETQMTGEKVGGKRV